MAEIKITLASARVNAGFTQEQVAQKMGVAKNRIINLEKGRNSIKPTELVFLSQLYKIPIDNLFLPKA